MKCLRNSSKTIKSCYKSSWRYIKKLLKILSRKNFQKLLEFWQKLSIINSYQLFKNWQELLKNLPVKLWKNCQETFSEISRKLVEQKSKVTIESSQKFRIKLPKTIRFHIAIKICIKKMSKNGVEALKNLPKLFGSQTSFQITALYIWNTSETVKIC